MELLCTKCKLMKNEDEFSNDKRNLHRNGKGSYCLKCVKVYNHNYHKNNINKHMIIMAKYYQDHYDQILIKARNYYKEHKSYIRLKRRPEQYLPHVKLARRLSFQYRLQRKQMKLNKDLVNELYQIETKAIELGLTVDHIIPLQGKIVSGFHISYNLQLLTKSENSSKSNKFFPELGLALTEANQYLLYNKEFDAWIREKIAY